MNNNIILKYIEDSDISERDYMFFLESQYKHRAIFKHDSRRRWYKERDGYKILLAIENNRIVGQSCAFKDKAIIHGVEIDIWWGIDVFVISEARGKGIGKLMQKKYHDDLPNFCSAWYSQINGIVKRKCGSKELFPVSFCYYPISSFVTYIGTKVYNKFLKKNINLRISLPFFYSSLNHYKLLNDYSFREIELNERVFDFIDTSTLSESDFYIKRDKHYLRWRYNNNPNLKYHIIEINSSKLTEGIIFFSEVHKENGFYVSKIMDVFKSQYSSIKYKDYLYFVTKYFYDKKEKIDGLLSLTECPYFPRYIKHSIFLSTIKTEKDINNPYISYSDQDMTQMY